MSKEEWDDHDLRLLADTVRMMQRCVDRGARFISLRRSGDTMIAYGGDRAGHARSTPYLAVKSLARALDKGSESVGE